MSANQIKYDKAKARLAKANRRAALATEALQEFQEDILGVSLLPDEDFGDFCEGFHTRESYLEDLNDKLTLVEYAVSGAKKEQTAAALHLKKCEQNLNQLELSL